MKTTTTTTTTIAMSASDTMETDAVVASERVENSLEESSPPLVLEEAENVHNLYVPFFTDETTEKVDRSAVIRKMLHRRPAKLPAFIVNSLSADSKKKDIRRVYRRSDYKIVPLGVANDEGWGIRKVREQVRESCERALVPYIIDTLQEAMAGGHIGTISPTDQNNVAFRCADQLSRWAAYNTTPEDMVTYRERRNVSAEKQEREKLIEAMEKLKTSTKTAKIREWDARAMLEVQSGAREGPLPSSNMAYADAVSEMQPSTTTTTGASGAGMQSPYHAQMQMVVALLIETLSDPAPPPPAPPLSEFMRKAVYSVNQILNQARMLSLHDGVLLSVRYASESSPSSALVLHMNEAKMLTLGNNPTNAAQAKVDELLSPWEKARKEEQMNPSGLRRRTINSEGRGDGVIREDLTPLDIGYDCPNRAGYFRSPKDGSYSWSRQDPHYEKHERTGGYLPARAYVPISKPLQYVYLNQNGVRFAMASCFRTIPDILMPTSPMINLLLEGSMPYHMGSHAMLDEYSMLLWAAVERACPKGLRPVAVAKDGSPSAGAAGHGSISAITSLHRGGGGGGGAEGESKESSSKNLESERFEDCSQRAMDMLATARTHCHETNPLPPWCGKWFIPNAYLPRVTSVHDLNRLYSRDNVHYRRLVGEEWLRSAASQGTDRGVQTIMERVSRELSACEKRNMDEESEEIDAMPDEVREAEAEMEWLRHRDTSAAGRAEFVMTLALMASYFDLMESWNANFHTEVRRLREMFQGKERRYPSLPNTRCGGVGMTLRCQEYYEAFWNLCVASTASLLEIHEVIILMLNSRWIDPEKAVLRMTQQQDRAHSKMVRNAHRNTVETVMRRRQKNQGWRMEIVPHLRDIVMSAGHPGFIQAEKTGWIHERVAGPSGVRPDTPTYLDLLVFEEFHGAIPLLDRVRQNETRMHSGNNDGDVSMSTAPLAGDDDDNTTDANVGTQEKEKDEEEEEDSDLNELIERTKKLSVTIGRQQEADPGCVMMYYELPVYHNIKNGSSTNNDTRDQESQGKEKDHSQRKHGLEEQHEEARMHSTSEAEVPGSASKRARS